MALQVNTNVAALLMGRSSGSTDDEQSKTLDKLSSGLTIEGGRSVLAGRMGSGQVAQNVVEDVVQTVDGVNDTEGVVNEVNAANAGAGQKSDMVNLNDAISMVETAQKARVEIEGNLNQMRGLARQASSESLSDSDRAEMSQQFSELHQQVTDTINTTSYNGNTLLNQDQTLTFDQRGGSFEIEFSDMSDILSDVDASALDTAEGAQALFDNSTTLLSSVFDDDQSKLRSANLDYAGDRLRLAAMKMSSKDTKGILERSSSNQINSANEAEKTAATTKNQILSQGNISMIGQANASSQMALSLLQ